MLNFLLLTTFLNLFAVVLGDSNVGPRFRRQDKQPDFFVDDFDDDDIDGLEGDSDLGQLYDDDEPMQSQIAGLEVDIGGPRSPLKIGLPWEHNLPLFKSDDVFKLKIALLKKTIALTKLKCFKLGFKFGFDLDDLKKIELSVLKLKVELLKDAHIFRHLGLVVKIKDLEEILEFVKALVDLKKKLKPCFIKPVLIELKFDHYTPLFRFEKIQKLQVLLLKIKIALLKNVHDPQFAIYTKAWLFKLKIAALKLKIALFKNPFIFPGHNDFKVNGFLKLIVDVIDVRNGFPTVFVGNRIKHGLQWNHDTPRFDTDDVLALKVALLEEKLGLSKMDCYKKDFDFGWKMIDLNNLELSILKLKVALLKNPHAFGTKLVIKIKVLEELLDLVKEVGNLKVKLKPCGIALQLIHLLWNNDHPLFGVVDLEKVWFALLKLKLELLKNILHPDFFVYTKEYLFQLKLSILKLELALLKNPNILGHNFAFDVKALAKLIDEVIEAKKRHPNPLNPIIDHLEVGDVYDSGDDDEMDVGHFYEPSEMDVGHFYDPSEMDLGSDFDDDFDMSPQPLEVGEARDPLDPNGDRVWLRFNSQNIPLFSVRKLVRFKHILANFKEELIDVLKQLNCAPDEHCDQPTEDRFPYKIQELVQLRKKLLRLKIMLITDPHIFKGTRDEPLHGLLKGGIQSVVDLIDDVVKLLIKIFEDPIDTPHPTPEPTPHPTKEPTHPPSKWTGNGKCSNVWDFQRIEKTWNLRMVVRDAFKQCHKRSDCVSKFVQRQTAVSRRCSSCFGDFAECTKRNCFLTCLFKSESSCQFCADNSCTGKFERCAFGSWQFDWSKDIGYEWEYNKLGRRRMNAIPFEGTDLDSLTGESN